MHNIHCTAWLLEYKQSLPAPRNLKPEVGNISLHPKQTEDDKDLISDKSRMLFYHLNHESFYGDLTNTRKLSGKHVLRLIPDCGYLRGKNPA